MQSELNQLLLFLFYYFYFILVFFRLLVTLSWWWWWWFLNDVRKLVARITWRRFHSLPSFVVFVCFSNLIECYCYCYCSISFVVAVAVWIKLPGLYYCTTRRSKQNKNKNKKRAILAHQPVTNGDNSDGISSKKERKLLAQVVVVFIDQYLPSYRTTTTTNSNLD